MSSASTCSRGTKLNFAEVQLIWMKSSMGQRYPKEKRGKWQQLCIWLKNGQENLNAATSDQFGKYGSSLINFLVF